ncbi:unnamed protein product [Absidia cylindrospora]
MASPSLVNEIARGARRSREDGPDRGRRDERRPRRSTSRYRLVVENVAPGTNWQVRLSSLSLLYLLPLPSTSP